MERIEADDSRTVLQDALEGADDDYNVAALRRIFEHLASGSLELLGRMRTDRKAGSPAITESLA
ncbi:hypothetical protein OKW76_07820 [Sphingomonas sp. S1-29]|uniref:hypothetical protein n=1 Tax=Sphingomonas sp. S1-29 TaxID=2991074 RepID=UPI002240E311|nr:hypothetical protein [Sphingomonas sp. S1-29]UZK70915.1 hypothetical protein OKW76_07820 [Sphingomonas sp. S1-29]